MRIARRLDKMVAKKNAVSGGGRAPAARVGWGAAPWPGLLSGGRAPSPPFSQDPLLAAELVDPHLSLSARCEGPPPPQTPFWGGSLSVPPRSLHRAGVEAPPVEAGFLPSGLVAFSLPHPLRRCGIHPLPVTERAALCARLSAVGAPSRHTEPPSPGLRHPQTSSQHSGAHPVLPARCFPPGEHPQPFSPVPLGGLWESPPAPDWGSSLPSGKTQVLICWGLFPASPSHSGTAAQSRGLRSVEGWPSCCLHSGSLAGCAVTRVTAWGKGSHYFPA